MIKIKLLAALMAVIMTVTVAAVCSQSVTASVTNEEAIGFTGETYYDDFYDATGHCEDWANYTITQESNYCKDDEVFTGNTIGYHTLTYTAPEDLEIVSLKFTLYHEEPGVTLTDHTTFTPMECETADNNTWMLKGSFANATPVTVKKGDPLLTADIKIDVEYCGFNETTGVETFVYLSIDELQVETAEGRKVIIGDENTTEPPTYDPYGPTNHCTSDPADVTTLPEDTTEPMIATSSPADTTEPFEPVIKGDVNNDGTVDILDAILIQKYAGEKIQLTDEQIHIADVNNDGNADTLDAILIQEFAAGIITEFPNRS